MTEALFHVDHGESAGGLRYPVGAYRFTPLIAVVVHGLPVAQGSMKSFGPGRMVHSNAKALMPWRQAVAAAIEQATLDAGLRTPLRCDDPVRVESTFTLARPASYPKARRVFPSKRPDVDKCQRAIFDALTISGLIVDDALVIEETSRKAYPGEHPDALEIPGVRFTVCTVHP